MKVDSFYITLILCVFAVSSIYPQSASNTGSIYGTVRDPQGNLLSNVQIKLESNTVAPISTRTSTNGSFWFANLSPGRYSLSFFRQDFAPAKLIDISVSIGTKVNLDVTLERISSNTGIIFGIVTDQNGGVLQDVNVTIESELLPLQQLTTAQDGSYRFENLPAGKYLLIFKKKNYLKVKREQIELRLGGNLQINVQLVAVESKKSIASVESRSSDIKWTFSQDYLKLIPNADTFYAIVEQTPAINSSSDIFAKGYPTPGAGGQYVVFVARGLDYYSSNWFLDGLNITLPDGHNPPGDWKGDFPVVFDLNNAEEIQIVTAGNDISIPTGAFTVNVVTKQGGREWHGSGSLFYSDDSLQSDNTPQEFKDTPEYNLTNRIDSLKEYGFELGGPIISEKLFTWSAFYKGSFDVFNRFDELERYDTTSYNLKANWNLTSAHRFQFEFFKTDSLTNSIDLPADFFDHKTKNILPGIWSAHYSWSPSENTILFGRYGYIGAGVTSDEHLLEQAIHDTNIEVEHFAENLIGGDHQFRFGFEFKTHHLTNLVFDGPYSFFYHSDNSALPGEPLTEGFIFAGYPEVTRPATITRTSLYAGDFYRKGRLTLDVGIRFDRQVGKNSPRTYPSPFDVETPDFLEPGFEKLIPSLEYPGKDPGVTFDDFSPRFGATYDLTGTGKFIAYGNIGRYYDAYNISMLEFSEIHGVLDRISLGFSAAYHNLNGDHVITPDEISDVNLTNFNDELSKRLYDPDLSNSFVDQYVVGIQTKLWKDWNISAAFTHSSHHNFQVSVPLGLTQNNFHQTDATTLHTPFGDFDVPLFTLSDFTNTGIEVLRTNKSHTQTYDGFELMTQKAMSNHFLLSGGLILQRQRAHNYAKDFAPWFFLPLSFFVMDPQWNYKVLENQPYSVATFVPGIILYSEWLLKVSGAYQFPWDVSLGAFLRYQQGVPYGFVGDVFSERIFPFTGFFFVEGNQKLDNIFTLDLKIDKEFRLRDYGHLDLILEIFNVTNSNPIIQRETFLGAIVDGVYEPNPELNIPRQFLSARALRLGLRYNF